jgi:Ca2+-transporting ATPase
MDKTEVLKRLDVQLEQGLNDLEAEARLRKYGPNELVERGLKSPWRILWEQLISFMVVILIVAALISALLGDLLDAVTILVIVILNALLGFVQEYRAERAMTALKRIAAPVVKVRRNGQVHEIQTKCLVPGDIVILETGTSVPADCRLVEAINLRLQEASLTGESLPIDKVTRVMTGDQTSIGDRHNMVYMSTSVTYGRGLAVVTETGMNTALGRIAGLIQTVGGERTPLQRRMDQLGKNLALIAILIVGIMFALGFTRGEDLKELFLASVAMAVAAIPEGLTAVVTISLALGAQRMLKRNALIRKLPAVEALGSVTIICSDKTGTLTENRMTVRILDVAGHTTNLIQPLQRGQPILETGNDALAPERPAQILTLVGGALCNDATLEKRILDSEEIYAVGDPTEGALLIAAARFGLWKHKLEKAFPRVSEIPFSSDRKRMTTAHPLNAPVHIKEQETVSRILLAGDDAQYIAFTKGTVEGLLEISNRVWVYGRPQELDQEWRRRIEIANQNMAEEAEQALIFVGMVGILDPPRPEVREAVATCKSAGIRPIMITGDHPHTALHIARELNIALDHENDVLTGQDLNMMSITDLERHVDQVPVYARVSPEHKLNIVTALQNKGEIVAMTGDGVNDAPALRKSDIGVSMGITGTDVAKESADMVILDDNFTSIVCAVEEGRTIFDNIQKFVQYTLISNAGELWVMLIAPFLGMPLPLTALQILWINLVTDGLPGLALSVEPAERDIMRRPPCSPKASILGVGIGRRILWIGLLMGFVPLGLGYCGWRVDLPTWQTMLFTTLTLSQMGNALSIRSSRDSFFNIGIFSNLALLGSVLLTLLLQVAVIYWAPLRALFDTRALSPAELAVCLAFSTIVFWAVEFEKLLIRRP